MNKDILFIVAIFILIILGIYFVFFNGGISTSPVLNILNSLKQETGIDFSNIEKKDFVYKFESGDQSDISGAGFYALNVGNEATDAIRKYFEDNGFKIDFFETGDDLSGISYHSKDKNACLIKTTVLLEESSGSSNKLNASVFCGELAN